MKKKAFQPVHFYLVFNPLLNKSPNPEWTQAHEFYYQLKRNIEYGFSDHLYWGKISITQNKEGIDFQNYQKVFLQNKKEKKITHLFISDFNNLWVGRIEGIVERLGDEALTLPFYKDKDVEIWFKVNDMALLSDNYVDTYQYLQQFKLSQGSGSKNKVNDFHPYMENLRYPLMVVDPREKEIFDSNEGVLIKRDLAHAFKTASKKILNPQHSYTIPNVFFSRIPKAARNEILKSELEILETKNVEPLEIAKSYIKALELTFSDIFLWHLKSNAKDTGSLYLKEQSDSLRFVKLEEAVWPGSKKVDDIHGKQDGKKEKLINLMEHHFDFTLKDLFYFLGPKQELQNANEPLIHDLFEDKKDFLNFVKSTLKENVKDHHLLEIQSLPENRGPLSVSYAETMKIRNLVLGIGCLGLINQMIASYYHFEIGNIFLHRAEVMPPFSKEPNKV